MFITSCNVTPLQDKSFHLLHSIQNVHNQLKKYIPDIYETCAK